MRLNITDEALTLKELQEMFEQSSNVKDVYHLCHQAGCPVYVIRDTSDKICVMWHPMRDDSKNVIKPVVTEGIFQTMFEGKAEPFEEISDVRKNMLASHMLGDNPFDPDYLVWKRLVRNERRLSVSLQVLLSKDVSNIMVAGNINSLYRALQILDLLNYGKLLRRDLKGEVLEETPDFISNERFIIKNSDDATPIEDYTKDLRKLIVVDNFDRDAISDELVSDDINSLYSDKILYLLSETVSDHDEDYFKLVQADYTLYDATTLY